MKVVIDTNVVVSSLMTMGGICARVVEVIRKRHALILTREIMGEYREVICRKELRIGEGIREEFLQLTEELGEMIEVEEIDWGLPDLDDNRFLDAAVEGRVDLLVTGN